jgi:hypothetical protein
MVDWSFGVNCSRAGAWNLAGRDDATAALAAKVLTLFSDMMCVCVLCVMSRKMGVTSVESCIIAESADLLLREPRFNTQTSTLSYEAQGHKKHTPYSEYSWSGCWVQEH